MKEPKNRNLWKVFCCTSFCLLLCFYAEYTICNGFPLDEQGHVYIDVQEEDGRYVTWREKDAYMLQNSLCFSCRDGSFVRVLTSYDDGETFLDETERYLDRTKNVDHLIIDREATREGPVCFRFITKTNQAKLQSREYRIAPAYLVKNQPDP